MKKSAIAIFAATILMLSTVTMLFAPAVVASPGPDAETIQGVLTSDYYTLYPYETKSIDFGISKYGEMIDGTGVFPDVGLQYPGYEEVETHDQRLDTSIDPFANEYVEKELWLNGWLLEIRYTHRMHEDRRVVTMAMSADMAEYGGEWLNGHDPDMYLPPTGGRKSTGYVETEDLEVLYDGPRRYVAICRNHIYDWYDLDDDEVVDHHDETWPLVDFYLTFIFNKVKKEIIILKDVKVLMSGKALVSPLDIQLSNREEWDLGPQPEIGSYAHFYHQEMSTCYGTEENSDVHLAEGIYREFIVKGEDLTSVPVISDDPYTEEPNYRGPIVPGTVRVYVYDEDEEVMVWQEPGEDYDIDMDTGEITWYISLDEDDVEVIYKLMKHYLDEIWVPFDGVPHLYDVAQIISDDEDEPLYVGWKAFWPTLSDYTVDGWPMALEPLINVSQPEMLVEPEIPFVVGEWDTMLGKGYPLQFRGVEVVGITDWCDAWDADAYADDRDWSGAGNYLDYEVMFQLDEVFNPWDLISAVHKKDTSRWVEFFEYDEDFEFADTSYGDDTPYIDLYKWVSRRGYWDDYCSFAERVLVDGELIVPLDNIIGDPDDENYASAPYTYEWDGYDILWFLEWDDDDNEWIPWDMDEGAMVKVLYSTDEYYETNYPEPGIWQPGRYEWIVVGRDAASVDSVGSALVTAAFKQKWMDIGIAGIDMLDPVLANQIPWVMAQFGEDDDFEDYMDELGRAALKDDWCTYWPVASSNTITVGGPLANVLSYYANDFTDGFYAIPEYASSTWDGMITGVSCWQRGWQTEEEWNVYESDEDTGYAVISTYKDINGTVVLSIWGHWGRDTYYATQWFHGDAARGISPGIVQLQEAPECLTSIILEIDYDDPEHPEFSIVEALGTITEFDWEHEYWDWLEEDWEDEDKGGLHDP
jgi:hypothetical protein